MYFVTCKLYAGVSIDKACVHNVSSDIVASYKHPDNADILLCPWLTGFPPYVCALYLPFIRIRRRSMNHQFLLEWERNRRKPRDLMLLTNYLKVRTSALLPG